ncbi:MAG: hypothetical protein ACRC42_00235 [Mycoplasma sp.]
MTMNIGYNNYVKDYRSRIIQKNIEFFKSLESNLDINQLMQHDSNMTMLMFAVVFAIFNIYRILFYTVNNINKKSSRFKAKLCLLLLFDNIFIGFCSFFFKTITNEIYEDLFENFKFSKISNMYAMYISTCKAIFKNLEFFIEEVLTSKIYFKW